MAARVDFGPSLVMMQDRLNKHYRRKAFEWDSASRYTSRGLGRAGLSLGNTEGAVPWEPQSTAANSSIRVRATQTRKTGFIGDAFVFTAYHNMADFYAISTSYYGRKVNYLKILNSKYGVAYLFEASRVSAYEFLERIEGSWGKK